MTTSPSVLLIFGTSHAGKTTLAGKLGTALGWEVVSTDSLARHPGRPWPKVKDQVAEYFSSLSDETIYWFLQVHYGNMRPGLEQLIGDICQAGQGFILEGSALRPGMIASLNTPAVMAVGLYADRDFLRRRMHVESGYEEQDDRMKQLIDRFIERSLRDNEKILETAREHGLHLLDVSEKGSVDQFAEELAVNVRSED